MAEARVDDTKVHLTCGCGEEIVIPLSLSLDIGTKEDSDVVHLSIKVGDVDMSAAWNHQFEKHMGLGDLNWEVENDNC